MSAWLSHGIIQSNRLNELTVSLFFIQCRGGTRGERRNVQIMKKRYARATERNKHAAALAVGILRAASAAVFRSEPFNKIIRRKAPIYWPLSTASGSYTIWLYYHRLNGQTLYAAVNQYVEPKIGEVGRGIARIEDELKSASGGEATRLRDRLNETQAFLSELRDLREELLRIAELPYEPNLNDGVIVNAAPPHRLFNLRSWSNDTKNIWDKLKKGEYDWAHMAYKMWPDRVRAVCKKDRSIAIAHGLEDTCETGVREMKQNRKRKK